MDEQIYSEDYSTNPVQDMEVDSDFHSNTDNLTYEFEYSDLDTFIIKLNDWD